MTSIKLKQFDMCRHLFLMNSKRSSTRAPTTINVNFESPISNRDLNMLVRPRKLNGRSLFEDDSFAKKKVNSSSKKTKSLIKTGSINKLNKLSSMRCKKLQQQKQLESVGKYTNSVKLFRPDYTSTPNYNLPKTSTPVLLRKLKKESNGNKKIITATTTTKTTKRMINLATSTAQNNVTKCKCHYYNSTFKDDYPIKINLFETSDTNSTSCSSYCSFSLCSKNKLKKKSKINHHYVNYNDYVNNHQSIFYNYQYMPTLLKTIKKTTTAKTTNIFLSSNQYYQHQEQAYEYMKQKKRANIYGSSPDVPKPSKTNSKSFGLINKLKQKRMKRLLQAATTTQITSSNAKKNSKRKFIQNLVKDTKCLMQFENIIRV
jgi:hypothetical protein